jgi:hypothetical protein
MKNIRLVLVAVFAFFLVESCKKDEPTCVEKIDQLAINQLQVMGSHNSYRQKTFDPILQFIYANLENLPPGFSPDDWDYDHLALDAQFNDYGVRSIELDVYHDPAGGLFYNRMGLALLGMSPESGAPELLQPGLKVLHFPDLDYNSNYLTFKQALQALKTWSVNHPNHVPMVIQVEALTDNPFALLGPPFTNTLTFDKTALESIDAEIKSVFGENLSGVVTPDNVRGTHTSLNEAILHEGWPEVGKTRGKVLFVLDATSSQRANYLDGHASLQGRTMFVYSEPGMAETAFLKYEDPRGKEAEITQYVQAGYMVRTRADADTKEARSGDVTRREAAFTSGAQIVSTDYYRPDPRGGTTAGWTTYSVSLPGGVFAARPNPVNAPADVLTCDVLEQ